MPTLNEAVTLYLKKGYETQTDNGERVTLVKPKKWSLTLVVLSLIGLVVGIIPGIIFAVLLVLDYALKKRVVVSLTVEDVKDEIPYPPNPQLRMLLAVGFFLFACAAYYYLGGL